MQTKVRTTCPSNSKYFFYKISTCPFPLNMILRMMRYNISPDQRPEHVGRLRGRTKSSLRVHFPILIKSGWLWKDWYRGINLHLEVCSSGRSYRGEIRRRWWRRGEKRGTFSKSTSSVTSPAHYPKAERGAAVMKKEPFSPIRIWISDSPPSKPVCWDVRL